MASPTRLRDMPLGVLRAAYGPGRLTFMVMRSAFLHAEIAKLVPSLPVADRAKPFWVFALPKAALDVTGRTFTITVPAPAAVKATGHDTYDQAEERYAQLAVGDAGKSSVARGPAGMRKIGTED